MIQSGNAAKPSGSNTDKGDLPQATALFFTCEGRKHFKMLRKNEKEKYLLENSGRNPDKSGRQRREEGRGKIRQSNEEGKLFGLAPHLKTG